MIDDFNPTPDSWLHHRLLADLSDAVILLDPHGAVLAANPAAIALAGRTPEDFPGLPCTDLFAPQSLGLFHTLARHVSDYPAHAEIDLLKPSGTVVRLQVRIRTLASNRLRLAGRDITALRIAEERSRQLEDRFRDLFTVNPDAVAINRLADGVYVEINDGFADITGYSRDDVIGRTSLDLGIWADPKDRQRLVAMLLRDGEVRNFEALFRMKGPRIGPGLMSAKLTTLGGELHILTATKDLTAWKQAEAALQSRSDRLQQAELLRRRLEAAIEQASEDILITDPQGLIRYCNASFERITGYSRSEVIGRNPRFLKSGKQDPAFYRTLWTTILDGQTWTGRLINRRKDGSLVVEDATISPIRDEHGLPLGFVSVKRDITAQLEIEARLRQAETFESLARLAGGIAHDFNNILTVIDGYGRLVLDRLDLESPLREPVRQVLGASEKAAALTRQLLAFSRKQIVPPRPLSLNTLVADSEAMLRQLLGPGIDLAFQPCPTLAEVLADSGQIHQLLLNLVTNARDAMPHGGTILIETSNVDECRAVRLCVTDTGTGMDAETQQRIFEPFFTTKPSGKGTGLGLATVFGIVQQNRGWISVASEPGKGSRFDILLPRIEPAP